MKTEDIIKYALIAAGAYLVWEYVISPMLATPATTPATGTTATQTTQTSQPTQTTSNTNQSSSSSSSTNTSTQPFQTTSAAADSLSQMLQNLAGAGVNVDADGWSYYYAQLPGRSAIPAATFSTMLNNAGITAATRSNPIQVGDFVLMLTSVGLSGVNGVGGVHGIVKLPPTNIQQAGMGNLRGGFKSRPNAFGGSGGGSGRRQTIH